MAKRYRKVHYNQKTRSPKWKRPRRSFGGPVSVHGSKHRRRIARAKQFKIKSA